MVLEESWAQKQMFLAFEKGIFQLFANVWVTKLKPFCERVRQSVQNYSNQILVIWSILQNSFWSIFIPETNVLSVWKGHYSEICKYLSD